MTTRKFLTLFVPTMTVLGAGAVAFSALPARALSTTFPARATVSLCGDYAVDPAHTTIELKYRVGSDPTTYPLTINASHIDTASNTGTFDIELPSTNVNVPMSVSVACHNTAGVGPSSNEKLLTNCDYLALLDTDGDGLTNAQEDSDCSNAFSPGDASNPDNLDTDGDGVRDLVERLAGTDPTNPGDSPRPWIFKGGSFDPDGDGNANAVAWRHPSGTWFIKDMGGAGHNVSFQFGLPGDIPFTYKPKTSFSDVGVIRRVGTDYQWFFHGEGFYRSTSNDSTGSLLFGNFGDNIVLGPWESPGTTSPAVARLYNNNWEFYVLKHDGSISETLWGGNGDIPMVADYDGDGIFDVAVYRPAQQDLSVIYSSTGGTYSFNFGSGTAEYNFRGDVNGDGKDDITFWEPATGEFTSLLSGPGLPGFNSTSETQLGLYQVHLPLPWNVRGGKALYTVVDHATCNRYFRLGNEPSAPITVEQWGLQGDSLG